jgi:hypothetical protein
MMAQLYDLAKVTTTTVGTGTITLGTAISGYLTFALAGVQNGDTVFYGIRDGASSEVGTGVYTTAGTTLTRSVIKSTNSNSAISLSGTAEVYITVIASATTGHLLVGGLLVGPTTAIDSNAVQIAGTTADTSALGLYRYANDVNDADLYLLKSRNATLGSQTVVQDGDGLGTVHWGGSDGTAFQSTAGITAFVDGTPAAGSVPGKVRISTTAAGDNLPTWHFEVGPDGVCVIVPNQDNPGLVINTSHDGEEFGLLILNDNGGKVTSIVASGGESGNASIQLEAESDSARTALYVGAGDLNIAVAEAGKDLYINGMLRRNLAVNNDHTVGSTTATEVTDLKFSNLNAGSYIITYYLVCSSTSTSVGIGTGINFTDGDSAIACIRREATTGTTAATGVIADVSNTGTGRLYEARSQTNYSTTSPNMLNTGGFSNADQRCLIILEVLLVTGATGDLELWHSSETNTDTTIGSSSYAELRQIADFT